MLSQNVVNFSSLGRVQTAEFDFSVFGGVQNLLWLDAHDRDVYIVVLMMMMMMGLITWASMVITWASMMLMKVTMILWMGTVVTAIHSTNIEVKKMIRPSRILAVRVLRL